MNMGNEWLQTSNPVVEADQHAGVEGYEVNRNPEFHTLVRSKYFRPSVSRGFQSIGEGLNTTMWFLY